MDVERETYNTSRIGLNELYGEAKDKLQQEAQVRQVSCRLFKANCPHLASCPCDAMWHLLLYIFKSIT